MGDQEELSILGSKFKLIKINVPTETKGGGGPPTLDSNYESFYQSSKPTSRNASDNSAADLRRKISPNSPNVRREDEAEASFLMKPPADKGPPTLEYSGGSNYESYESAGQLDDVAAVTRSAANSDAELRPKSDMNYNYAHAEDDVHRKKSAGSQTQTMRPPRLELMKLASSLGFADEKTMSPTPKLETKISYGTITRKKKKMSSKPFSGDEQDHDLKILETIGNVLSKYEKVLHQISDSISQELAQEETAKFTQALDFRQFISVLCSALVPAYRKPDHSLIKKFSDALKRKVLSRDEEEKAVSNEELNEGCIDFLEIASRFGEIIVSELHLPKYRKTLKPVKFGGVAGGDKFLVR
jgi:hypothetical protein